MAFCPTYTILGIEFEEEELLEIARYGMGAGVEGLTYFYQCADRFDEFDDEIQDFLSDWCFDKKVGECSFAFFAPEAEDVTQLKKQLVYAFVELKAQQLISDSNQLEKGRKITKRWKNAEHALSAG